MAEQTQPHKSIQTASAWQLVMFKRSLKKQLKLDALLRLIGDVSGQDCLLVTCGDNNGALNWHFRQHGGRWTWGDVAAENLEQISAFLEEPVLGFKPDSLPFEDSQFDCIVAIDVLEHLDDDQPFLGELRRILKTGGVTVVTVPNGDPTLLANRIKVRVGMVPQVYGHRRAGYTHAELRQALLRAGFDPQQQGGYSRFFTEMVELMINYAYVRVLAQKQGGNTPGRIAPTTSGELKTHGAAYRAYTFLFPLLRGISKLDRLLSSATDNAVILTASKPAQTAS